MSNLTVGLAFDDKPTKLLAGDRLFFDFRRGTLSIARVSKRTNITQSVLFGNSDDKYIIRGLDLKNGTFVAITTARFIGMIAGLRIKPQKESEYSAILPPSVCGIFVLSK